MQYFLVLPHKADKPIQHPSFEGLFHLEIIMARGENDTQPALGNIL